MSATCTDCARLPTSGHPKDRPVPRAGANCRPALTAAVGLALILATVAPARPAAAGYPSPPTDPAAIFAATLDRDGNGVEDLLDAWSRGESAWTALRDAAVAAPLRAAKAGALAEAPDAVPKDLAGQAGPWSAGRVRLLWFDPPAGAVDGAAKAAPGGVAVLHRIEAFDTVVLSCDASGLAQVLGRAGRGRLMLDRDGVPAVTAQQALAGVDRVREPGWSLGRDWSGTVAIIDSGCDTAHGDLGDRDDDDKDGPPPAVGDAADWYPADGGWPLYAGYKVVGWTDVTDDFPEAQGPWDYHWHGTALASVAAGSGYVDGDYAGMAPSLRLAVVKFYDFDQTWHAWAGDFLAACAWVLDHRDIYRVRSVLVTVNWDAEEGTSLALGRLVDAGLTVVAAMGNQGDDPAGPGYPACLPFVLTAGGVDDAGAVAAFSGRGLADGGKPDLVAPAGGLLAAAGRVVAADNEPNDTYSPRWGTSLAAAHTVGAVALLDEALRDRGVELPADRMTALTRGVVLAGTAEPVASAETADGLGTVPLPAWTGPDRHQGWGLLRIDAAVRAACLPLLPGADQLDTLSADFTRPVAARRLDTAPGVRYLVEAVPAPGLDIVVDVVDPVGRITGVDDVSVRRDAAGPGVSEFVYVHPGASHWLFLAVKRKSGSGTVTLRLREADGFAAQGFRYKLPGRLTGSPNVGSLGPEARTSVVVPSLVAVDDAARAVSVLDSDGNVRPGWPVYLFPPVSADGGLNEPLVWDLDGQAGDEIVFTSGYGAAYFFAPDGTRTTLSFAFNVPLSTPVGLAGPTERRVASVDATGLARIWAAGGALRQQRILGHVAPLAPAAGALAPGGDESLVVAFADGHVYALDEDLADRPGWPRDTGAALTGAPILVDLDGDGGLEVVLSARDAATGLLTMHVLGADGLPAAGDGTLLATPGGGPWVAVGPSVVTGRYGTGELGVTVLGLAANGAVGAGAAWGLARGVMRADGTSWAETWPGLDIRATTAEGQLRLDSSRLTAPLAWDILGGTGTEPAVLAGFHWTEVIPGVTSIPGGVVAWYVPDPGGRPLATWLPREQAGPDAMPVGSAGAVLMPRSDGSLLRVSVLDEWLAAAPVPAGNTTVAPWPSVRRDGRNSAAYPLDIPVSATPPAAPSSRLAVFPNPGAGRFRFRLAGSGDAPVQVDIYDLRGRRVRTLVAANVEGLIWDGRGGDGRTMAGGTYLAVARSRGRSYTTRIVLTR